MDFIESLQGVSREVRQKRRFATDEAKTINFLVQPLFKALGYDPGNPDDVTPEFTADFVGKSKKVDYALKKDGKPIIFVEVKSATKDLGHEHTEQLQVYFSTKLDVRFGILTNGLEYRFYADLDNQNVMDNAPFLTVNMVKVDGANAATLSVFRKSSFDRERAKSHARGLKYKLRLRSVLEEEFRSPSDELIKLLIKRTRPELKSVTKKVTAEMKPIILDGWHEFADGWRGNGPPPPPPPTGEVQVPVFGYFKKGPMAGQRYEAKLCLSENNGELECSIVYEGQEFTPSGAAQRAIERNLGTKPSVNGFWFWKVKDPDTGIERPMSDVRSDDEFRHRLLLGR